ncbi:MAG: sulfite exporter TauE/SafE family protein [Chitinophagales bacterium]|nr:sulfite exporter TauE/SafE family protein [Chitinophagales bacterium]
MIEQKKIIKIFTEETAAEENQKDLIAKRRRYRYFFWFGLIALIVTTVYFALAFGNSSSFAESFKENSHIFYWMLFVGFVAELVAGSMGMGYGVICTTVLLIMNIPLPVISASIHSAESFTSAASSISHFKLGNVNKKLIRMLALPAILGAVAGALLLTYVGKEYAGMARPVIAVYTMYLGMQILRNAFIKKRTSSFKKKINIPALGFAGGFIDSFGGGGWGPLVTGTFIKNGRTPRYVVGSSVVSKFFLTFASAITFIFTIGIHHWNIVAGLLIGGIVAAPFSAMLVSRLPVKKMFFLVGSLVIIMGMISIYKTIFL